jgi:serine/threonine protein kinase
MSDTIASKSHIMPTGIHAASLETMSTTENWPSANPEFAHCNYDTALRDIVASMTPRWRAQMRRDHADGSGSFACKFLDKDRTIAKATYLELYALATLRHDNVLRLVEAFQDYDCFYFVTNRCYGDLNAVWVTKGRAPPIGYAYMVSVELFDALEYIDTFRLVHRDIKPANVFLKTSQEFSSICIGDFGMAVPMESDGSSGEIAGSPAFFAKEVWAEGRQAASSDVFAAGLTLLALFAGAHPVNLESFLHVCPEVLRSEEMAPRNVWRKFEILAQGDQRAIAKTLKNHCPHDVEKRITLAIVACILSSEQVIHESISKSGVVDRGISEFFRMILNPDRSKRATARTSYEYVKSMQEWGTVRPEARLSLPRRLSAAVLAAVTKKKAVSIDEGDKNSNYESGAICRRRLSLVGVCDTRDVPAGESQPFSPLPRLMGGAPPDPWDTKDANLHDSK